MKPVSTTLIVAFLAITLLFFAGATAQIDVPPVDTMGDLGMRSRSEDLDSYWLDTSTWAFYGYRPHQQAAQTRFMGTLPSYFDGKNYYSSGMNPPQTSAPLSGGLNLNNVQIENNGTWH